MYGSIHRDVARRKGSMISNPNSTVRDLAKKLQYPLLLRSHRSSTDCFLEEYGNDISLFLSADSTQASVASAESCCNTATYVKMFGLTFRYRPLLFGDPLFLDYHFLSLLLWSLPQSIHGFRHGLHPPLETGPLGVEDGLLRPPPLPTRLRAGFADACCQD